MKWKAKIDFAIYIIVEEHFYNIPFLFFVRNGSCMLLSCVFDAVNNILTRKDDKH